jgi:uncharacterized protein (TIGR01777 family)
MEKRIILLAGATGFIGKELIKVLQKNNEIRILTRHKDSMEQNYFYWNPDKNEVDTKAFEGVTHIINLCGAGIADKNWTSSRKKELELSRTLPASFLFAHRNLMPELKQYISASGINCYDFNNESKIYDEEDPIASDFVSTLVKKWEESADQFSSICPVLKLRISFVISDLGGAVKKLEAPIKMGFGAAIGTGKQAIPWIHLQDLCSLFEFGVENKLEGVYNANAGNSDNKEMTVLIAKKLKKRLWLPNIPAFVMKLILGELSVLVLKGIKASNQKIVAKGFKFKYSKIEACFD